MKFICDICGHTDTKYKVRLSLINDRLVCKDMMCCSTYMTQIKTSEYEGLPKIHRDTSDTGHSKTYDADRLWKKTKDNLLDGNFLEDK